MKRTNKKHHDYILSIQLGIIALILFAVSLQNPLLNEIDNTNNLIYDKETNTIDLNSMTLKQKISQMLIVFAKDSNADEFQQMLVGGIFVNAQETEENFKDKINLFQDNAIIPLFVSTDMEGCRNPFENFKDFSKFSEISSTEESYLVAKEEGEYLKKLGFNMNFAPVVDLEDTIWQCRSFIGDTTEISNKAKAYIKGMRENHIISVAKHYPGKTLNIADTHTNPGYATIEEEDLIPFDESIKYGVGGVMVSHMIVDGNANSESKPAMVSEFLTKSLSNKFTGLIITDEIGMVALKEYYTDNTGFTDFNQLFIDLFKANNDMILIFDKKPKKIYSMVNMIERAIMKGEISEGRIDNSVKKILEMKGLTVV